MTLKPTRTPSDPLPEEDESSISISMMDSEPQMRSTCSLPMSVMESQSSPPTRSSFVRGGKVGGSVHGNSSGGGGGSRGGVSSSSMGQSGSVPIGMCETMANTNTMTSPSSTITSNSSSSISSPLGGGSDPIGTSSGRGQMTSGGREGGGGGVTGGERVTGSFRRDHGTIISITSAPPTPAHSPDPDGIHRSTGRLSASAGVNISGSMGNVGNSGSNGYNSSTGTVDRGGGGGGIGPGGLDSGTSLNLAGSPAGSSTLSASGGIGRSPRKSVQYAPNPNSAVRRRGSTITGRRKSRELMPGPIRRASQVLISLTSPDGASLHGECSRRDSRIVPQITLLNTNIQRLPMKDFGAEVRASMDVDQFLQQAVLLLDIQETSLEGIVDRMVKKVLDCKEPVATLKEAKVALFTHESVNLLARTIQGTYISEGGGFDYDQSWLCAMCSMPSLHKRHVAIARLKHPANMGRNSHEVRFFILVLTPSKEKGTKNALETGRTFATIFADMDFRQRLLEVQSEGEFKSLLLKHAQDLASEQSNPVRSLGNHQNDLDFDEPKCRIAQGLCEDLRRRLSHYISDYIDGVVGHQTIHKTISTIFFLYFACLLPTIAFGVLNDNNTNGKIGDIRKAIIGQTVGGLSFGFFGGQPLVIIMTTAPLCLYIKVIYGICEGFGLNFHAMYACVGLWNTFFLVFYAVFDVSRLMKWCTRSTEEIFALFISIAFVVDAFRDVYKNFKKNYYSPKCLEPKQDFISLLTNNFTMNETSATIDIDGDGECRRDATLLFLLLMLGTVWVAVSLYNFNKTPYLQASKRELLADYALPCAVIFLSFVGSYVFKDIPVETFRYSNTFEIGRAHIEELPLSAAFAAMGLGFSLSLLFFMDQNIAAAMVNNPCNKLKKGCAYHLDLFVVGILNGFLSLYGFPWMHGVLPHSPLHVRSLADVEERVDGGHVYEIIVKVRETRITSIVSHILIGLSVFLLPYPLAYIPTAVLDGLFLYMAITALSGSQMFERITLLFMEQAAYPPNHYIRRCPQRKIHLFTFCQLVQLGLMCFFGFSPWPYIKMVFPIVILLLLPVRHKIITYVIDAKYLEALDGEHQ
ncbi:solute carrier family 4 member 11-like isoform X2 [Panonychus citri]|uniref:solute carrier family 4 member 11-like isoform X2 n=1 Tax=Panonychus citri TaxID=50023 RepID=UPI002307BEF9|nr:solute carrier family 4 member 11-like isoform X2 [Panonychus citri]